jgi:transcriptional regulator with XRE-family HTH domain
MTAGLTQKELADRVGIRQPTISGYERGVGLPTSPMLTRLADALGLPADVREELEDRVAELRVDVSTGRLLLRHGEYAIQLQVGAREAAATSVCAFHHAFVPGLLQTADYPPAAVLTVDPETDVEALVRGRQERQRLLLDPTRTFRFVMDEIALRRRLAPATVLRGQLRRLRALQDGFDHIEIGVIPDAAPMHAWTMTGFDIEGDVVEVGLPTRRVLIRDPREVDEWRRLFDRLAAHSLRGDALATLLREIDAWLATLPEQRRPRSRPPLTGTSPALSTPTSRPLRESNRDRRASERV